MIQRSGVGEYDLSSNAIETRNQRRKKKDEKTASSADKDTGREEGGGVCESKTECNFSNVLELNIKQ